MLIEAINKALSHPGVKKIEFEKDVQLHRLSMYVYVAFRSDPFFVTITNKYLVNCEDADAVFANELERFLKPKLR